MKTIFAHRLNEINLTNRFQSLYDTKENKNLKILDFGIGQDNSIISKKAIEILNDSSTNYNNWKYAENGENSLINSFIKFAFKQYEVRLNNDEITLSMGIKEVLNSLAFILINPNDLVVSTTPGYNVFQRKAKMLGGVIKELVINNENNYLPNIINHCKQYHNNHFSMKSQPFTNLISLLRSWHKVQLLCKNCSFVTNTISALSTLASSCNAPEIYEDDFSAIIQISISLSPLASPRA